MANCIVDLVEVPGPPKAYEMHIKNQGDRDLVFRVDGFGKASAWLKHLKANCEAGDAEFSAAKMIQSMVRAKSVDASSPVAAAGQRGESAAAAGAADLLADVTIADSTPSAE